MKTTCDTIIDQLGGMHELNAFVGAKDFVDLGGGVSFKLGRGARDGITHVTITLTGDDLYDVRFQKVRGARVTERGLAEGVMAEQLVATFEDRTGFLLTL